jgi:DNA-binding winged helix-turn-helix (wHTH) protein
MATKTETEPRPVGTVGDIAVFAESNSVTIQDFAGCEQVTVPLRDVRVLLALIRAARDEVVQR